jgi:hypothetical protein
MCHQDQIELLQLRWFERCAAQAMRSNSERTERNSNPFEQGRISDHAHAEEVHQ